jgi:hypothetical protein
MSDDQNPNPPDPHVTRSRKPLLAVIAAILVVAAGAAVVLQDRPGAGMGGSVTTRH